jgi:hypothetical protein
MVPPSNHAARARKAPNDEKRLEARGANHPVTARLAQELLRSRIRTFHHGVNRAAARLDCQGNGNIEVVRGGITRGAAKDNGMGGLVQGGPGQGLVPGGIAAHEEHPAFL